MGAPLKVSGDPKRPNDVQGYEPILPAEPTGDIAMLVGLVCAMAGLLLKLKVAGWVGVFCGLSSFSNLKSGQTDIKSIATTFMYTNPATNSKLIALPEAANVMLSS